MKSFIVSAVLALAVLSSTVGYVEAQDTLPHDNGLATYHTAPRYRESESHPLRIVGYILHPIGWVLREGIFRPLSYFASSTETTRSVMGYREPYDYRTPECFSADDSTPDCRGMQPFNYDNEPMSGSVDETGTEAAPDSAADTVGSQARQVFFPDVNFDFNKRALNDLGRGRVRQVAQLLSTQSTVKVVLQGNADSKGADGYNEKLGLDRAEVVRSELITLGVSPERLSTVSFGESQPVFADDTEWARAVNRRVAVQPDEGAAAH
jgi:peptidoglycan-associated lipoprotein